MTATTPHKYAPIFTDPIAPDDVALKFMSVTPPAATHDFSFLAPCPASGLIIHGEDDTAVPPDTVHKLVERLSIQKGVEVAVNIVPGANHYFTDHLDPLIARVSDYLDASLAQDPEPAPLF